MKTKGLLIGALFLCLLFPFSTSAFAYSQIVAFGDSLSDNGDEDFYGFGRFTDPGGLVWVDYLAQDLGVPLLDMAYGGARTDYHPATNSEVYGFNWQVNEYLKISGGADSDTLYTVWIGGNDLLNLGGQTPEDVIANAVLNIGASIGSLYMAGARDIVLMNMPNLGATPLMNGENSPPYYDMPEAGLALSTGYNAALAMTQAYLETLIPDLNLFSVDIFALMEEFLEGCYFDDTTGMFANVYENPEYADKNYLFWDSIHPTTYAHSLIADAVYSQVAPVPEPSTILLLGLGLIGLAGYGRKKFIK